MRGFSLSWRVSAAQTVRYPFVHWVHPCYLSISARVDVQNVRRVAGRRHSDTGGRVGPSGNMHRTHRRAQRVPFATNPPPRYRDDHGQSPLVRHPRIADSRSRRYRDGAAVTGDHTNRDADQTGNRVANDCTTRISDRSTGRAADDNTTAGQRHRPPRTAGTDTDGKDPNSHARRDGFVGIVLDSRCRPTAIAV